MNFKIAEINLKYFSVLQVLNFKHSRSYGLNFKYSETEKDKEFTGKLGVYLVYILYIVIQFTKYSIKSTNS